MVLLGGEDCLILFFLFLGVYTSAMKSVKNIKSSASLTILRRYARICLWGMSPLSEKFSRWRTAHLALFTRSLISGESLSFLSARWRYVLSTNLAYNLVKVKTQC